VKAWFPQLLFSNSYFVLDGPSNRKRFFERETISLDVEVVSFLRLGFRVVGSL